MNYKLLSSKAVGGTDNEGTEVPEDYIHVTRLTVADVVKLLAMAPMENFDNVDIQAFNGVCNPETALIGYFGHSNGVAIIADGDDIEICDGENSALFNGFETGKIRKICNL